jgi:hypothetical protein
VNNERKIEQALAARAFVSSGRASMLTASQRVKKNKVKNETGIVQAVTAWASVGSGRASMLPALQGVKK